MTFKSCESLLGTVIVFSNDDEQECNSHKTFDIISKKEAISIISCCVRSRSIASGLLFGDIGSNEAKIKITNISGYFSCCSSLSSKDSGLSPITIASEFDDNIPIDVQPRKKRACRARLVSKRREVHPSKLIKWR
mmetsp:Transcript_27648/g.33622  ORF Transcript_27648/g.33622 Transcript_27648/m.33622 type:complete len:135 (+) Transcript_27648:75-479(+)